jgi:cold shock CspA family protein
MASVVQGSRAGDGDGARGRRLQVPAPPAALVGEVSHFDEQRGLGEITVASGGRYPFHATAMAGGTRRIEVGARVCFVAVAGHGGRHEAACVRSLGEKPAQAPAV